jgi:hypothetical protein
MVAGYNGSYGGASACSPTLWPYPSSPDAGQQDTFADGVPVIGPGGGWQMIAEWHCSTLDRPGHVPTLRVMAQCGMQPGAGHVLG